MDLLGSWMCVVPQKMSCCKQRNAHANFNQLCAENKAVRWSSQWGREILGLKEGRDKGNPEGLKGHAKQLQLQEY
jgi:hypothetical protein